MANSFDAVNDDFMEDMEAIRSLVNSAKTDPGKSRKERIAAANSAILLVAATFEEFVREMAREYARAIVAKTNSFEHLPKKLASTAWKRTMEGLAKIRFEENQVGTGYGSYLVDANTRFQVIHGFCTGDLTQDIYRDLIHNENNMRPNELNALFKVSGLGDVCKKISDKQPILDVFGDTDTDIVHGKLISGLEDFFERRNEVAHALNTGRSMGPEQIIKDIDMLKSFGQSLCETLNSHIQ